MSDETTLRAQNTPGRLYSTYEVRRAMAKAALEAQQRKAQQELRDFWTLPPEQQAKLANKHGESPKPLTQEEKQEMEGCGL